MKKISLLFLVCTLSCHVQAQNVKIVNGIEYSGKKSDGVFDNILDYDANYFYVKRLSTAGAGFTQVIQKIDRKTLNVVYTMEYKYDQSNRDLVEETEIQTSLVKDNFFVFTRKFNIKESVVYLLFRKFDATTGTEIGTQQAALNIECTKQIAPKIKFYVEFSEDKSKMLIGSNTSNEMTVYETKNFSKLGTLTLNLKTEASSSDFNVDNSGNLVYLSTEKGTLSLVKLPLNSRNPLITNLSEKIPGLKNSHIELEENSIIVSGLTTSLQVFCINVESKTNKILFSTMAPFSSKLTEQLKYTFNGYEGAANKYYAFEKLVLGKESIYVIQSQSFSTVFYGNGKPVSIDNQKELIVTKFKVTGEFEWMKLIPKNNYDKSSGFNFISHNDNLYFFYLQHPKDNIEEGIESYDNAKCALTSGIKGCSFVCAKIDASGNVQRKSLFVNKGWCYKPISKNIVDEGERSLTIKMIDGKNERYDKLIID